MSGAAAGGPSAPTIRVDVSGRVAIVTRSGGGIGRAARPWRHRAVGSAAR